jgi:hypothetical protein
MKPVIKIIWCAAVAFVLAAAIAPRASAQNTDDDEKACARAAGSERRRCLADAEALGNAVQTSDDFERFEHRLRLEHLGHDLSYLRDAAGELSRAARGGELDLKAIAESASEIRRRAARLRDGLALPSPRKDAGGREERVISDTGELRAALSSLSALISDAVRDLALTGRLLDAAKSPEARSELDAIVELSGRVKAGSETLVKTRR